MTYYVIIRGPLGCGKSIISKKLSNLLKAKYFAVDRVLDEFDLAKEKEQGYISQKSFFKVNDIIAKRAKKFLDNNIPVIFDGNFYWRSSIDDLINKLNYPHHVFTLKAPLKICIERDGKRGKVHGVDATKAVYKKSTSFNYGNIIDVTKPLNELINKILSYLIKKKK